MFSACKSKPLSFKLVISSPDDGSPIYVNKLAVTNNIGDFLYIATRRPSKYLVIAAPESNGKTEPCNVKMLTLFIVKTGADREK